jgi:putative membrane protein
VGKKVGLSDYFLWLLVPIAALVSVLQGIEISPYMTLNGPIFIVTVCVLFAFVHGYKRYGVKHLLVFFAISAFFGMFYENLSITTGFPFGHYHYSNQLGPKFLYAPYILNIAYFQMLYLSWTIASLLVDQYGPKLRGAHRWVLPVVASFVMVMWDAVIDPNMSTVLGHWLWHNGGAYYGVPFENYLGWFLCVYSMNQCFGLYSGIIKEVQPRTTIHDRGYWLQAIAIYCTWPLTFLLRGFFLDPSRTVISADHQVWKMAYLYQTAGIISLVTMYFVAAMAILRLLVLRACFKNRFGLKSGTYV